MTIRIVPPNRKGPTGGWGTRVFTEDGAEISGIKSINIFIGIEDAITATLDIYLGSQEEIEAIPLLSIDSLEFFAKHYGYKLTKIEN